MDSSVSNSNSNSNCLSKHKLDEVKFKADVDNFNWNVVYHSDNVDIAWNTFVRCFNKILDYHAPWRVMDSRTTYQTGAPVNFYHSVRIVTI